MRRVDSGILREFDGWDMNWGVDRLGNAGEGLPQGDPVAVIGAGNYVEDGRDLR